jgi:hypothetical protein
MGRRSPMGCLARSALHERVAYIRHPLMFGTLSAHHAGPTFIHPSPCIDSAEHLTQQRFTVPTYAAQHMVRFLMLDAHATRYLAPFLSN